VEYVARFQKTNGQLLRFDTRIYLESFIENEVGVCVGAIVGKNPGSAMPVQLDGLFPLVLNGDKMLPTIGNRFVEGFRLGEKPIPENAYVRVWNLFYVCNKNLEAALHVALGLDQPLICPSEAEDVPVAWFGWGGNDSRLNLFKSRFLHRKYKNAFFYNHHSGGVTTGAPSAADFAKHTQGMPALPVIEHLARVL
jgi:hypothetical protein